MLRKRKGKFSVELSGFSVKVLVSFQSARHYLLVVIDLYCIIIIYFTCAETGARARGVSAADWLRDVGVMAPALQPEPAAKVSPSVFCRWSCFLAGRFSEVQALGLWSHHANP